MFPAAADSSAVERPDEEKGDTAAAAPAAATASCLYTSLSVTAAVADAPDAPLSLGFADFVVFKIKRKNKQKTAFSFLLL